MNYVTFNYNKVLRQGTAEYCDKVVEWSKAFYQKSQKFCNFVKKI